MAQTQSTVWKQFESIPAEVSAPLLPVMVGPQAGLHRYTVPAEKVNIALGPYVPGFSNGYAWPDQTAGSTIDLSSFALYMDAILLQYFQHLIGGGGITITAVGGFFNRIITSSSYGFKSNGATYPRNPLLYDRDVQVGDVVRLKLGSEIFFTSVNALIADVVASVVGSATGAAANATSQSASVMQSQTSGTSNDVSITATNGASYNGIVTGDITETYTVTVITGGAPASAVLQVASASGRDNQASITPSSFGSPTSIGTRGLTATWSHTSDNFVAGQVWTITVKQNFTAPVATSGGTYNGTQNQTYIVTVTSGGFYASGPKPQISVTTSLGTDTSGPTTVNAASTFVLVGTLGVEIEFSGTALRAGDIYYIPVTGPTTGAYRTIQLNNNLPVDMQSALDLELELNISENYQVPEERLDAPPAVAWSISQSQITINSGITATNPTLTNAGAPVYVPLESGPNTIMYANYREWLSDNPQFVGTISVATTAVDSAVRAAVASVLGTVDPLNPLAYATYKALLNSNGQPISYVNTGDPTNYTNWQNTLNILIGLPVYSLVTLSNDPNVFTLVKAHVDTQSASSGSLRRAWFVPQRVTTIPIVTSANTTDGQTALATLTANPNILATQYTYLACTSGNVAFITAGVAIGDVVRYLFTVDGFGNQVYSSFTVVTVVNQNTLILASPGNSIPITTPVKFEIWRNQTTVQQGAAIMAVAEAFNDKRVITVFPDVFQTTDGNVNGYFVAAAFAGFTAGIAPQQGMRNIPITGFTGSALSQNFQLQLIASAGVFVVDEDNFGNVFVKYANTTDVSTVEHQLEVVQRDEDMVTLVLYNRVGQFFESASNTDAGLSAIATELYSAAQMMEQSTSSSPALGPMLTNFVIVSLRPSLTLLDHAVLQATASVPFPVEDLDIELTFSTSS